MLSQPQKDTWLQIWPENNPTAFSSSVLLPRVFCRTVAQQKYKSFPRVGLGIVGVPLRLSLPPLFSLARKNICRSKSFFTSSTEMNWNRKRCRHCGIIPYVSRKVSLTTNSLAVCRQGLMYPGNKRDMLEIHLHMASISMYQGDMGLLRGRAANSLEIYATCRLCTHLK